MQYKKKLIELLKEINPIFSIHFIKDKVCIVTPY